MTVEQRSQSASLVSQPHSRIALYVIPTDEELMIARHTLALLSTYGTQPRVVERTR